jgi:hypothetical protein
LGENKGKKGKQGRTKDTNKSRPRFTADREEDEIGV